jgi:hypothetical protein
VPLTFFAHQAPFAPIARRWPSAVDGVALVIGSMSPDMAYVLHGSRFALWAHDFPGLVTFCLPVTLAVSWLVVRVLAPVVPDHLPQLGSFQLRDYRGLATHRFTLWKSVLWAQLGALSHVGLDEFTHGSGWFARHVPWYTKRVTDRRWLGSEWTVFRTAQYLGHVGLTALCLWLLWRHGKARWMQQRADLVPASPRTRRSFIVVWGLAGLGLLAAGLWVALDSDGSATDIMRLAAGLFAGLTIGSLIARRPVAIAPGTALQRGQATLPAPERSR